MWGANLSVPLCIVALVSRYLTNKLMRRMPILCRSRLLCPKGDVPLWDYAELDRISPAYSPAKGRLHTCYSPVRRSPAGGAEAPPPLPLDLHVLSL